MTQDIFADQNWVPPHIFCLNETKQRISILKINNFTFYTILYTHFKEWVIFYKYIKCIWVVYNNTCPT